MFLGSAAKEVEATFPVNLSSIVYCDADRWQEVFVLLFQSNIVAFGMWL